MDFDTFEFFILFPATFMFVLFAFELQKSCFSRKKGANSSFYTKSVHKFQNLKIMRKINVLKIRFFDDHFSFLRQLHLGPINDRFSHVKISGPMGPTPST